MTIHSLVKFKNEPVVFFDEKFQFVIDSHLTYLRTHPDTKTVIIDPNTAIIYKSDFYGLLTNLNIESRYHRAILLVNEFSGPREFDETTLTILVPRKDVIDKLIAPFKNTGVISV